MKRNFQFGPQWNNLICNINHSFRDMAIYFHIPEFVGENLPFLQNAAIGAAEWPLRHCHKKVPTHVALDQHLLSTS